MHQQPPVLQQEQQQRLLAQPALGGVVMHGQHCLSSHAGATSRLHTEVLATAIAQQCWHLHCRQEPAVRVLVLTGEFAVDHLEPRSFAKGGSCSDESFCWYCGVAEQSG
jgi:hypothetical protein